MTLFTLKYAPQSLKEVIGQELAVSQLKDFVLNYKQKKQKSVLLYGPIGNGKTSSVYALAKELNYELLEINSSDIRKQEKMNTFLSSVLGQMSLFFRPKIVLIDEIDCLSGTKDRGCISALLKGIQKSVFPVVLTANDAYEPKLKELRKESLLIEYPKLDYKIIVGALQNICGLEKIKCEEKALNTLARQVDGDLRGALIDLQICAQKENFTVGDVSSLSDRKRTETIINALHLIFKSSNVLNALGALDDIDVDLNEVFLWLDENLPKEYLSPAALAKAYEYMSRADVFNGRISRQQHWRFLVYINNLLTAGISSAKTEKNTEFVQYKPTMRILKIWQAKMKLAKRKEIAEKLALKTHTSQKVAFQQVPYLQEMFRHKSGAEIAVELELSAEEVEWLRK